MEFVLAAVLLVVVTGAIGVATGDLGGGGDGYDHTDDHYDDDGAHGSLVNVSGTPMAGDVDINGNPFGVDDGMDYGLDD